MSRASFDDGDIVLIVKDDEGEHQYRLHSTILSLASPVFRDMMRISQPPMEKEASATPTVFIPDVSSKDISALIGALYNNVEAQAITFDIVWSILKRSHKFQMGALYKTAKRRLQQDWPLNLSDYIARQKLIHSPEDRLSQSIEIVEMAERYEAYELLPTAFHEIRVAWFEHCEEIAQKLSQENFRRLSMGFCMGLRAWRRFRILTLSKDDPEVQQTRTIDPPPSSNFKSQSDSCETRYEATETLYKSRYCSSLLTEFKNQFHKRVSNGESCFVALQGILKDDFPDKGCRACAEWFKSFLEKEIKDLWENIPVEFALPKIDPALYTESLFKPL